MFFALHCDRLLELRLVTSVAPRSSLPPLGGPLLGGEAAIKTEDGGAVAPYRSGKAPDCWA